MFLNPKRLKLFFENFFFGLSQKKHKISICLCIYLLFSYLNDWRRKKKASENICRFDNFIDFFVKFKFISFIHLVVLNNILCLLLGSGDPAVGKVSFELFYLFVAVCLSSNSFWFFFFLLSKFIQSFFSFYNY